jgi:hypothetical protein
MPSKLQEWSSKVKARDGKCMSCGSLNDLHAHHIKHKQSHPELMLDLSNGKTLCYRCHKAEHELNRPLRIRSNRPQRRTLEKRIAYLENFITEITSSINKLEKENKELDKLLVLNQPYQENRLFVKAYNKRYG